MERAAAQLRSNTASGRTTRIDEIGSPGSVDPKMKTARRATSAPTRSRQPQPVTADRASVRA
jgi:hypothetical protein